MMQCAAGGAPPESMMAASLTTVPKLVAVHDLDVSASRKHFGGGGTPRKTSDARLLRLNVLLRLRSSRGHTPVRRSHSHRT
ncbi:hypothetical protein BHE74_00036705 [Ensete ventricosum]|nr:hypothetical protein BHE74_00036705 [Ensete ventricosum]RZR75840.1 hypothetical protein BHM03_00000347 [Ensete ventricosum]